jgi:chromosome segregation ATPase
MIDTLGKVVLDMRNDQKKDEEIYKKLMERCKTELKSETKAMEEDLSNMKTATQKVKEDLAAAGKSGNQVELARKKCDALRNSISNLNRTISVLKNQRKTEEHQFTVHHAVMKDNVDLVEAVEKYLLEGTAKMKAAMKATTGDEKDANATTKKELTSLLEVQASKGTTEIHRLLRRVSKSLNPKAESDPAAEMTKQPKIMKSKGGDGMPEGMDALLKELKQKMKIARETHKKQKFTSKGLYEKEMSRLEVEFQMLDAQLEKAEESYEDMKKTHQRAVDALNALSDGDGDWTYKLLADNAKLAVEASEIQCKKFEEAYHARTTHRIADETSTKAVVNVIRELFHSIVHKAKN